MNKDRTVYSIGRQADEQLIIMKIKMAMRIILNLILMRMELQLSLVILVALLFEQHLSDDRVIRNAHLTKSGYYERVGLTETVMGVSLKKLSGACWQYALFSQ